VGPGAYVAKLAGLGITVAKIATGGSVLPGIHFVQYEVSPNRRLETPSGESLPDLVGAGRGDLYFGEGWTLGLQEKHFLGIRRVEEPAGWELETQRIMTYDILNRFNQYIYTIRDIENIITDLSSAIDDAEDEEEKQRLTNSRGKWEDLLNKNLAYKWDQNLALPEAERESFEEFKGHHSALSDDYETLIFSAGPSFEYSRRIYNGDLKTYSVGTSIGNSSSLKFGMTQSVGSNVFGNGITLEYEMASDVFMNSEHALGRGWESGQEIEQTVGFVLQDDDVGDNIATRVFTDPYWSTPLFFQEPGSVTSDPWEAGTNRAVDFTMETIVDTIGTFDYGEGAHYKLKLTYTGDRSLENGGSIDFLMYDLLTDEEDNPIVRFNGDPGLYRVKLTKQTPIVTVNVSVYPAEIDRNNSAEKQYVVKIIAEEEADQHINRSVNMTPTFADLRAPRALVTAPYQGERISPVFFPTEDPFDIQVVSEDWDLASVQLQIRSKQPDGVWEPWRNLSGMLWEEGGPNTAVTLLDRLDRRPPHREFTFRWAEDAIRSLGVGEYALRAIATDKATIPNSDMAPPPVVFLVDESEPSVLNSIPDYQARERERIYRGELSVTFTDEMRSTDFSDRTFYVTDLLDNNTMVAGYVSYSPALRKTVFVPMVPFQPNGFYRVEIKTDDENSGERGVHDLAGNPLDNAFMWTFRTTDAPFEPIWSMNFSVTDGTSKDANKYAGVEYGALDEEDEKDARAVPALANQLRMVFLNRNQVQFERDIRPADGRLSHHWFFVILNAQEYAAVTLKWRPSIRLTKTTRQYQVIRLVEFDEYGNVTNTITLDPTEASVNPDTGEIDPVLAYTYVNQGEASRYFRLDVQKVSFVAGTLEAGTSGWKFLSVPITPQRAEPFVNLGDDIDPFQLYQYDTGLGGYKIYPYDIGQVGLQTGHGYFTRLWEDAEVDVGGTSNRDDVSCTLDSVGWHAIGNPFILPVEVADLIVSDGTTDKTFDDAVIAEWVEGTLYRWDIVSKGKAFMSALPLSDGYEAVTSGDPLDLWEGYWLRTKQPELTLTIPAPAGIEDAEAPLPESLNPPIARAVAAAQPPSGVEGDFDLRIVLYADFASDWTTTLGTRPDARTGWDFLDQSEPPTLGQTASVYFDHRDWGAATGLYNTDYQPTLNVGEQCTWQFVVFTDKQNAEMKLSWENAVEHIPGDVMLWFRQVDSPSIGLNRPMDPSEIRDPQSPIEWLDMRAVRSVEIASPSLLTKIPFEVRAERFAFYPPSEVQVVAGEAQVFLSWKAEAHSNLTGYTIKRWDAGGKLTHYPLGADDNEFTDADVLGNTEYTYQLSASYKTGAQWQSDPVTVSVKPVIFKTALLPCYPNPFNPEVWIPYELVEETEVTIRIYNTLGGLVRTLSLGVQPRGSYATPDNAAYWDGCTRSGKQAASGIYLYRLEAGTCSVTKKMVLLR
ncbi:MAG: Ig-like domain-containing protein, partial [Candidatus Latescibacteria bacterium]|nr:Ig-like domain-containing protein [Candidatus Latescibacterota bacterium]